MSAYHEPHDQLSKECRDVHRALASLKEEIEAVDWYTQRMEACTDRELRQIMGHNRDEEIEHASKTLEWLRRHVSAWDRKLREQLFVRGSASRKGGDLATPVSLQDDLGLGSLRQDVR